VSERVSAERLSGVRFLAGKKGRARRETLTAYLFLLPAIVIIFLFGIWPVAHALYVSLHSWRAKPPDSQCFSYWFSSLGIGGPRPEQTDCVGLDNYVQVLGLQQVPAVVGLIAFSLLAILAYSRWRKAVQARSEGNRSLFRLVMAGLLAALAAVVLALSMPGLLESGEWTYLISMALALVAWLVWKGAGRSRSTVRTALRLLSATALIAAAVYFFFVDFNRMWELGDQVFFKSMIYTVFYSVGAVPVQLGVSLVLAYVLFQGVRGKGAFRLLYFMPYIAPSVATAVVFKRIFSLRDTGLMNRAMTGVGLEPLRWLHEAKGVNLVIVDLINQVFHTSLTWPQIADPLNIVLSGPSLALVSIIMYSWWVFIGYDTVIYLAGLGAIPNELYEAAEIDGAGRWALFRKITIPLLSPTTFFLTVIGTIGTFKAFNHIWIMREQQALDTVDTASILIFQTFRADAKYGLAAAMAFVLFAVILILSQIQNRIGEKLVFYG
jgi:multiple sugar transport system permease protein